MVEVIYFTIENEPVDEALGDFVCAFLEKKYPELKGRMGLFYPSHGDSIDVVYHDRDNGKNPLFTPVELEKMRGLAYTFLEGVKMAQTFIVPPKSWRYYWCEVCQNQTRRCKLCDRCLVHDAGCNDPEECWKF